MRLFVVALPILTAGIPGEKICYKMSVVVERLKLEKSGTDRFVNAVLISKGSKCVLVDTGFAEHFETLKEKIGDKKLEAIIITHCHLDHCGTAAQLQKFFNSKIILSEYENEKFKLGENSDLVPRTEAYKAFLKNLKGGKVYDSGCGDIIIKEDEKELSLLKEWDIQIILTPGHTPGSLSVICGKDLVVGDLFNPGEFGNQTKFGLPGFLHSTEDFAKSMEKLYGTTGIERIHAGHIDNFIPFGEFVGFCKDNEYVQGEN